MMRMLDLPEHCAEHLGLGHEKELMHVEFLLSALDHKIGAFTRFEHVMYAV